jgi:hypothetical protein
MAAPNLTATNLLPASKAAARTIQPNNNKKDVIHQQDVPYAEATIRPTIRDVNITVN